MFNLFDIMRNAQGGAGIDAMARQFGLAPDQAQKAVEALLPAFALALQRSAMNPAALSQLFASLGGGHYARFFENPAQAFSPQARSEGDDLLARIFGSPEVSRQVAQQAAAMAGVGTEVMRQMMPVMATTLMGGMSQKAATQGMGDLFARMAAMFHAAAAVPQAASPSGQNPWAAWGEMVGAMMGGAPPPGMGAPGMGSPGMGAPGAGFPGFPGFPPPTPAGHGPRQAGHGPQVGQAPRAGQIPMGDPAAAMGAFTDAVGRFFAGLQSPAPPAAAPPPPPPPPEPETQAGPNPTPAELWAGLFQTGRDVQDKHIEALQSILDSYKKDSGRG
jgi:hypothetical protein